MGKAEDQAAAGMAMILYFIIMVGGILSLRDTGFSRVPFLAKSRKKG